LSSTAEDQSQTSAKSKALKMKNTNLHTFFFSIGIGMVLNGMIATLFSPALYPSTADYTVTDAP
jgi:hypothetical protein